MALEVETGDAEILDIHVDGQSRSLTPEEADGLPPMVAMMIEEFAPPSLARFEMEFAKRCKSELSLDLQTPTGGRKYINAYPPKRFGAKRAVAFDVKSGRAEIYCRPENAKSRQAAEVVANRGEPVAVKVYLRSSGAVDEAIELTGIGLEERNP